MCLHNPYFNLLTKPKRTNLIFELPVKDTSIKLGLKYLNNLKQECKARSSLHQGKLRPPDFSCFQALEQNIGRPKLEDNRELKKVATRHGLMSTENGELCPTT